MTTVELFLAGTRGWRREVRAARSQARSVNTAARRAGRIRTRWTIERTIYRLAGISGLVYAAWLIYHPAAFVVGALCAVALEQVRSDEQDRREG